MEFPGVVEATKCDVEIQAAMAERNQGFAEEKIMLLRIGINLSDIIVDGANIFGEPAILHGRDHALP
ncbi:MAG: hypothetical protein VCE75_12615 [Alphaproteobacteria bacterium]